MLPCALSCCVRHWMGWEFRGVRIEVGVRIEMDVEVGLGSGSAGVSYTGLTPWR